MNITDSATKCDSVSGLKYTRSKTLSGSFFIVGWFSDKRQRNNMLLIPPLKKYFLNKEINDSLNPLDYQIFKCYCLPSMPKKPRTKNLSLFFEFGVLVRIRRRVHRRQHLLHAPKNEQLFIKTEKNILKHKNLA